ncbi:hypothetical protein CL614_10715, partial [archaeon]|nr:hypothetical protein [archaeon]
MEALEKDFQELVASEDSTVEDEIIQGILEPTVAEEEEVLDDETEEVLDDETEEVLEEEEEITAEELESYNELIAELKQEFPDMDFDNVEIAINEDGEVEIQEWRKKKGTGKFKWAKRTVNGKVVRQKVEITKEVGPEIQSKGKRKRIKLRSKLPNSFDPSDVASDDAVAIGEEDSDVQEYTVGKQARPTNVMVYRMVDGK